MSSASGATQLSIMIGSYYAHVVHRRTAIVGNDALYERIRNDFKTSGATRISEAAGKAYSYKGIDFYNHVRDSFMCVLPEYYDVIIVDMNLKNVGENMIKALEIVTGCDKKILVGSLLPWKSKECMKKLDRIRRFLDVEGLKMATMTYNRETAQRMEREYKIKVVLEPQEPDPFRIQGSNLVWIRDLVE